MGLFGLFGQKKLSPAQMEQVKRRQKILSDSLKIIMETENLDTFFSRYKVAEDNLNEIAMIAGMDTKCIAGETPRACLESLAEQKEKQTSACLDRYIRKETVRIIGLSRGRIKKAEGVAAIIEEYSDKMTPANLETGRTLANAMIEKIKRLEEK